MRCWWGVKHKLTHSFRETHDIEYLQHLVNSCLLPLLKGGSILNANRCHKMSLRIMAFIFLNNDNTNDLFLAEYFSNGHTRFDFRIKIEYVQQDASKLVPYDQVRKIVMASTRCHYDIHFKCSQSDLYDSGWMTYFSEDKAFRGTDGSIKSKYWYTLFTPQFHIAWIPWNLSFRYTLFHEKRFQTMLWHHNARVNSHKDESKRGCAFAFIFGVNWPVQWM